MGGLHGQALSAFLEMLLHRYRGNFNQLFHQISYSTRLSLLGQDLRFAKHWLLPALHLWSAKPFDVTICLSSPGSLLTSGKGSLSRGKGLSKTTDSSTCGTSLSLEAAVERRNLLREASRSLDGERVASRADSGGRGFLEIPSDPPPSSSSFFKVWMVESSSGNVNLFFFLLPTRSLNSFRSLSHLLFWFPSIFNLLLPILAPAPVWLISAPVSF